MKIKKTTITLPDPWVLVNLSKHCIIDDATPPALNGNDTAQGFEQKAARIPGAFFKTDR